MTYPARFVGLVLWPALLRASDARGPARLAWPARGTPALQPRGLSRHPRDSLAAAVPGFGGIHWDGVAGEYVVWVLDTADAPALRAAVATQLRARPDAPPPRIRLQLGRYAFTQLKTWQSALITTVPADGIATWGVSERDNRVLFGIYDPAARARVEAAMERLGIPHDAVGFERQGPVEAPEGGVFVPPPLDGAVRRRPQRKTNAPRVAPLHGEAAG